MLVRSIRLKLTFWYTGLLTLTCLLLGGLSYGLLSYSLNRDIDYALRGIADVLKTTVERRTDTILPAEIDDIFRQFFGFSPLERHIDFFNLSGQRQRGESRDKSLLEVPLSESALEAAAKGKQVFETIEGENSPALRVLTTPVVDNGRVVNVVRVGMSLENMQETKKRFLLIMAGLLPITLLFSGGGGWLLAGRFLRPIDSMTRTANRISAEHLSQRLGVSGSDDELDRLARTINDMLDRIDGSVQEMRRFSADASHELQTPLTILKGEIEVALLKQRSPAEYEQVLNSCLEEIDRINKLVEGLLLLARADVGALRLDLQPVDMAQLSHQLCDQLQPLAQQHGIDLHHALLDSAVVDGDELQLQRMLMNLIDNGIKYTPAGGQVSVSVEKIAEQAVIRVQDSGPGFGAEEADKIFDRFHRAPQARQQHSKGSGLGLSIARSIALAHHGEIWAESEPGVGSTFSVAIPSLKPSEFRS
ncbi:MAG: ATP-binding protein [Desulfofustis sp.]|jgi:two-component system, OmpR family, sensor kinase